MAFEGPFEDRLLIRERFGAYSDAAFRQDMEAWLANWSEECVWTVPWGEFRGKPAMRGAWQRTWEAMEKMAFFSEIGAIEVNGDRAKARCYCREILVMKDCSMRKVVGVYDDELVREAGVWLFAHRDYRLFIDEGNRDPRAS